jgi:chemotaxis protein MotB
VLFDPDKPRNPINRRISLILMTKQAEEAALKTDRPLRMPNDAAIDEAADTASPVAANTGRGANTLAGAAAIQAAISRAVPEATVTKPSSR